MKKGTFNFNKPSSVSCLGILHDRHRNDSRSERKARGFALENVLQKQTNSSEGEKLISQVRCAGTIVRELMRTCRSRIKWRYCPGARFSKAPETFRARKAIFRSSQCKNGEVYTPETSRMKWTSLHTKNMWINSSAIVRLGILHWLYGPEKFPGLSRNGPQALVVQRLDNTIHGINRYPLDSVVCLLNIYPLDSDLSGG